MIEFQSNGDHIVIRTPVQQAIFVNGMPVDLAPKEVKVFTALATRKGVVCTTKMMLTALYPDLSVKRQPHQKIIDVFVCKIRKELAAMNVDLHIESVWGRGYRMGLPSPSVTCLALPPDLRSVDRWIISRKVAILKLLHTGVVTEELLLAHYTDLSTEEIREWAFLYRNFGAYGLRTTCAQRYALAA